jgi:hypothetical protein
MPEHPKPPALAAAMLNFFSHAPDFAAMLGDIVEEFEERSRTDGQRLARRWYRREAFRNAWALSVRELRRKPLKTLLLAIACLAALNLATGLLVWQYDFHPRDFTVLMRDVRFRAFLLLQQAGIPFVIGWLGGRVLPGREWALAVTFATVYAGVTGIGFLLLRMPVLPAAMLAATIAGVMLRIIAFSLGCLWSRHLLARARRSGAVAG